MNRRNVCIQFKKQLKEYYEKTNDIIKCFDMYLGFLMVHALNERYRQYTHWQLEDMHMAIYNEKVDPKKSVLETLWNYTRRGGKTRGLTVVGTFWVLLDKIVIWRSPYNDQLGQCAEWFKMNPFIEKVMIKGNEIRVYNSPSINISVLSPGRVASREADCLIYDEMGWCFNHLAIYEYYKASRPMIAASNFRHILHASTPARNTAFREEFEALEQLEYKLETKFTSYHPWRDTTWITEEWIELERLKNIDCPWYIDQNYEALWVIYGGAVFNNYIYLGDQRHPEFPISFFDRFRIPKRIHRWKGGVDFNGEIVGHYLVKILYDDDYVYVIDEIIFRDLNYLSALNLWDIDNPFSLEVEDGSIYNIPFANACRRLGIPAIYAEMTEEFKAERIANLKKRKIIIDRLRCPLTFRNLQEAAYDQNSRLPKLEKRTDQHGLDALIHAMHESGERIHYVDHSRKKDFFGRYLNQNPIKTI